MVKIMQWWLQGARRSRGSGELLVSGHQVNRDDKLEIWLQLVPTANNNKLYS